MSERDWHDLYLRGLMSQLDLERYEELVCERLQLADELADRLSDEEGWDRDMVRRARAMLAVRATFASLLDEVSTEPISDELFSWPVEDSARTLQDRTAVRLVNVIIVRSIENGVGAVQITPTTDGVQIDITGHAPTTMLTTPRSLLRPLLARLKHVAHLDPERRGIEQIGHLPIRYCGRDYEIKVTVMPGDEDESARLEFASLRNTA
ncbi:MAG: hypothetical protein HZB16_18940 [Armatimonadetes bacterium]|nr:hypothetical protein [Armatimonadota bacterium]